MKRCAILFILMLFAVVLQALNVAPPPYGLPNPEPSYPAWFDTFNAPTNTAFADNGSTVISNWTKTWTKGAPVMLTGENLVNAYCYTQTNNGNGQWLTLTAVSGASTTESQMFDFPNAVDGSSMNLLWTSTGTGDSLSTPIPINQTNAEWMLPYGPDGGTITAGVTMAVFGQNFWYNNITPSVFVTNTGVTTVACSLVDWNPHKISFTVPSIANGTYQVWVHNGHGGKLGWSGPLTMIIGNARVFNGSPCYPQTYGAVGDGVTDSTYGLTHCASLVGGLYGSVSIPAGTFITTARMIPNKEAIYGAGQGLTIIQGVANYSGSCLVQENNGTGHSDIYISGCAFVLNSVSSSSMAGNVNAALNFAADHVTLRNVSITVVGFNTYNNTSLTAIQMSGSNIVSDSLSIRNCQIFGYAPLINTPNDTEFVNVTVYASQDGGNISGLGTNKVDFEGNFLNDYNPSDPAHLGFSSGRMLDFIVGGNSNVYIGNNTSLGTGTSQWKGDQNSGEWLMGEGNSIYAPITVTSASGNQLVIPSEASLYGNGQWVATIIKGVGFGQNHLITADSSGTLTLDSPWLLTPTSSSVVLICKSNYNWNVYNNTKTGNGRPASSAGVEFYGPSMINGVVSYNSISGTAFGIYNFTPVYGGGGEYGINQFNYFFNNTLQNLLKYGIYQSVEFASSPPTKVGSNLNFNSYWNNTITAATAAFWEDINDLGGLASTTEVNVTGVGIQGTTGSAPTGVSNTSGNIRLASFVDRYNFWSTATPTSTVTPTPTNTPTLTATPTVTPTSTFTLTPTPTPTASGPTPTPTATFTPYVGPHIGKQVIGNSIIGTSKIGVNVIGNQK